MRLLLINTCGAEGLVALAEDGVTLASETLPGRGTSETLMPAVARLFGALGWRVADLGALAILTGPGSFTGVRVGLSAAKGLCEAGGVGLVAVSRLAAVAAAAPAGVAVALLDAGRGEFYFGVYRAGECEGEGLIRREEIAELAAGAVLVTCEPRVRDSLAEYDVLLVDEPGVERMLALAEARIAAGEWADVASIDANYLRRTDAELVMERKLNAVAQ